MSVTRPRPSAWLAVGLLLLAGVATAAACGQAMNLLGPWAWDAHRAGAEPWRWWSAAFVHLNAPHLWGNLVALAVVTWLGCRCRAQAPMALAWLAAWPLTHAALWAWPSLRHYAGLSGVLHAGVVVIALDLTARPERRERRIGLLIGLGLAIKLLIEAAWQQPIQLHSSGQWTVATASHLTGSLAGLACAAAAWAWGHWRRSRAAAPMVQPQ